MNGQFFESPRFAVKCKSPTISRGLFTQHQDRYIFEFGGLFSDDFYVMKSKMKNLKVFTEVKKICTIFLRKKTPFAALLAVC